MIKVSKLVYCSISDELDWHLSLIRFWPVQQDRKIELHVGMIVLDFAENHVNRIVSVN